MRTLAFFLEGEFTLLIVVFVLSTTTILTTLFSRRVSRYSRIVLVGLEPVAIEGRIPFPYS